MPTPLAILLDPISLSFFALYLLLIMVETLRPARALPPTKFWQARALLTFVIYFYASSYLPLMWDTHLYQYQLFDLTDMNPFVACIIALLVFELLLYGWHRAIHENRYLWRIFHQFHHSAERIDTFGAFYFSPFDMIGFTALSSLALVVFAGVSTEASTYFLFFSSFLAIFQHTNISTPQWLGFFIQRPESHSFHHKKGVHRYNYSDLPIFDIIFGTFKNPKTFVSEAGFYQGASMRYLDMLLFHDVVRAAKAEDVINSKNHS